MKILIFDTFISGHHLEYLHHLYTYLDNDNEYIFAIPKGFENLKNKFQWSNKYNIKFDFLNDDLAQSINSYKRLKKSLALSRLLKEYYKKYNPDRILLVALIDYYPLLPLFIPRNKISGIIYKIYLYEWANYSLGQKIYEFVRQFSLSSHSANSFILNDTDSCKVLNNKWHTRCFKNIIDPYVPLDDSKLWNVRVDFDIPNEAKLFCHLGSMSERKGTMETIKAALELNSKDDIYFIFAGKVGSDIKDAFYSIYNRLVDKSKVKLIDDFCSYELLGSIVCSSDCLLLPYKRTSLSSGLIYYALQFSKNVIGPSDGLIGKLIISNKLGETIDNISVDSLAKAIEGFVSSEVPSIDLDTISPATFVNQLQTHLIGNNI